MKKIIMLSLVGILIAGGAYRYLTGTDIEEGTSFNISQYLPESINSFFQLGNDASSRSDATAISNVSNDSESNLLDESSSQTEEMNPESKDSVVAADSQELVDNDEIETSIDKNQTDKKVEDKITRENTRENDKSLAESITETAIAEQEEKNQNSEVVRDDVNDPEVVKLVQKLNELKSSIKQFDSENEELQQKFKNMLKQNKELATQLNTLNKQLQASN